MKIKHIFNQLEKIKILILDILFPIECLGCGKENVWLCDICLAKIPINQTDACVVCKRFAEHGKTHAECRDKTSLDGVIIACPWESKLLQNAIHKYKYNFIQNLSYPLSQLLIKKISIFCYFDPGHSGEEFLKHVYSTGRDQTVFTSKRFLAPLGMTKGNSRIVPVSLHPRRLRWRGFNQAQLLADKIADHLSSVVDNNILIRKKHTTPQMSLKKSQRLDNLQKAFQLTEHGLDIIQQGVKNFILIDDVLTTGATMHECAKVLKVGGAKQVWGTVLARG